jgi:hypothetical protein
MGSPYPDAVSGPITEIPCGTPVAILQTYEFGQLYRSMLIEADNPLDKVSTKLYAFVNENDLSEHSPG